MNTRTYLAASCLIFFAVGLIHLLRLFYHWPIEFAGRPVPQWVSYAGFPVAWGLAFWAYHLRRR